RVFSDRPGQRGHGPREVRVIRDCLTRYDGRSMEVGTTPPLRILAGTAPAREVLVMNWTILFIAGLFEIGWAVGLKYTHGFTRLLPSIGTVAAMVISMGLLGVAMKSLPVGTSYAVWVGIGTVGTAALGIILFHEQVSLLRLASLAFIVIGIVGLKLSASA